MSLYQQYKSVRRLMDKGEEPLSSSSSIATTPCTTSSVVNALHSSLNSSSLQFTKHVVEPTKQLQPFTNLSLVELETPPDNTAVKDKLTEYAAHKEQRRKQEEKEERDRLQWEVSMRTRLLAKLRQKAVASPQEITVIEEMLQVLREGRLNMTTLMVIQMQIRGLRKRLQAKKATKVKEKDVEVNSNSQNRPKSSVRLPAILALDSESNNDNGNRKKKNGDESNRKHRKSNKADKIRRDLQKNSNDFVNDGNSEDESATLLNEYFLHRVEGFKRGIEERNKRMSTRFRGRALMMMHAKQLELMGPMELMGESSDYHDSNTYKESVDGENADPDNKEDSFKLTSTQGTSNSHNRLSSTSLADLSNSICKSWQKDNISSSIHSKDLSHSVLNCLEQNAPIANDVISASPPSTNPSSPPTPRQAYSHARQLKSERNVDVMMALSQADMENIRTKILQKGGGVNLSEYLSIACRSPPTSPKYHDEIEALCEIFREIDVNGDGTLQYSELTNYLIEVANSRSDRQYIDQLIHTDYVCEDRIRIEDNIAISSLQYYEQFNHYILTERNQNRFKLLDENLRCLQIIRGHTGEVTSHCYLPAYSLLITASMDKTVKFWEYSESKRPKVEKSFDVSNKLIVNNRSNNLSKEKWNLKSSMVGNKIEAIDANSKSVFTTEPTFQCITDWKLAASQFNLCVSKSASILFSSDSFGSILKFNIDRSEIDTVFHAHSAPLSALLPLPDHLFASASDNIIKTWDVVNLQTISEWNLHQKPVHAMNYNEYYSLGMSGGEDNFILQWDCRLNASHNSKMSRRLTASPKMSFPSLLTSTNVADIVSEWNDCVAKIEICGYEAMICTENGQILIWDLRKDNKLLQRIDIPKLFEDKVTSSKSSNTPVAQNEEDMNEDFSAKSTKKKIFETLFSSATSTFASTLFPSSISVTSSLSGSSNCHKLKQKSTFFPHYSLRPNLKFPFETSSLAPTTPDIALPAVLFAVSHSDIYPFAKSTIVQKGLCDEHPILLSFYSAYSFTIITVSAYSVKIWNALTGKLLQEYRDFIPSSSLICSACLDHRKRKIIIGTTEGHIFIFNVNSGAKMALLHTFPDEISQLKYVEVKPTTPMTGKSQTQSLLPSSPIAADCHKIICTSRRCLAVLHDDSEQYSSITSTALFHTSNEQLSDVSFVSQFDEWEILISGAVDGNIIIYPPLLNGTPLQKFSISHDLQLHLSSLGSITEIPNASSFAVQSIFFLFPYRCAGIICANGDIYFYLLAPLQRIFLGSFRPVQTFAFVSYKYDQAFLEAHSPISKEKLMSSHCSETSPESSSISGVVTECQLDVRTQELYCAYDNGFIGVYDLAKVYTNLERLYNCANQSPSSVIFPSLENVSQHVSPPLLEALQLIRYWHAHSGAVNGLQLIFSSSSLKNEHIEINIESQSTVPSPSPTSLLTWGVDCCVHIWQYSGEHLGSLHQGDIAQMGEQTSAQWKWHGDIIGKQNEEAETLERCRKLMEAERIREELERNREKVKEFDDDIDDSFYDIDEATKEHNLEEKEEIILPRNEADYRKEKKMIKLLQERMDKEVASGAFRNEVSHFQLSKKHAENIRRLQQVKEDHNQKMKKSISTDNQYINGGFLKKQEEKDQGKEVESLPQIERNSPSPNNNVESMRQYLLKNRTFSRAASQFQNLPAVVRR